MARPRVEAAARGAGPRHLQGASRRRRRLSLAWRAPADCVTALSRTLIHEPIELFSYDRIMGSPEAAAESSSRACLSLDSESAAWIEALRGPGREAACGRLHARLLKIAGAEVHRRRSQLPFDGPELDDIAHQATADAMVLILGKLDQFRGESRFTTWAAKFAIFEVSSKIGRHFWQRSGVRLDPEAWERLPDRLGIDPAGASEGRELVAALRRAVEEVMSERQRRVFEAIVLNGVALDVLVIELASNRNAIYKALFDARRKLRAELVTNGYLDPRSD